MVLTTSASLGTWLIQSLDKATLGMAAVFNIQQETGLVGNQFSWLGSVFYLGWMAWEYPASYLLQRFPVGKTLAATVRLLQLISEEVTTNKITGSQITVWGIVLMCHAPCNSFAPLAVVRILLGALEAGCGPACMIIFGMYYTREEQPLRMGIWIGFGGIATMLSGLISYGIGYIRSPLSTWRVLYLVGVDAVPGPRRRRT